MKKLICISALVAPIGVISLHYLTSGNHFDNFNLLLPSMLATAGYTIFVMGCRLINLTIFNPVDVLGSFFGSEPSAKTKLLGSLCHYLTGFILAVVGKIALEYLSLKLGIVTGAFWGAGASLAALVFFSTVDSIHPRMKKGQTPSPGLFALHYGGITPFVIIIGHIIYGALLGLFQT